MIDVVVIHQGMHPLKMVQTSHKMVDETDVQCQDPSNENDICRHSKPFVTSPHCTPSGGGTKKTLVAHVSDT